MKKRFILRLISLPALLQLFLSAPAVTPSPAADSIAATGPASQDRMDSFLQEEAIRLDAKFLDDITNRQQWETRRAQCRRDYLDMLGLWPLPERTPLQPVITGVIEREEGFRVEKLHFQSRPH